MSVIDKNKIFFGLLHYVFSEQNNVNWAFKTSLVNFTGINTEVDNQKYKKDDLTNSIIEYIYDVKPYHLQFEQYIEKYSSQQDDVSVDISEKTSIDINIRIDAVTSEIDDIGNMSDIEYMDTHMANRLFLTKTQDKELIRDYLNTHFKGITVDGNKFNIDKSGYDAFLYDNTMYDYPTLSCKYCLVDLNERYNYPYTKKFIQVGTNVLVLNTEKEISKSNISIIRKYNNNEEEIFDYSIENNTITLFSGIKNYEKITVYYVQESDNKRAFVYVGSSFVENDDENDLKKFVNYTERRFKLPNTGIDTGKITVHIEKNGTSIPTNGYEMEGDSILVYDPNLTENSILIIGVIDYKYIYDKIYNWEDIYGQANNVTTFDSYYSNISNIQHLDGNNLLRPYYEKERPSELCVSQPYGYLMLHTYNKDNKLLYIHNVDYKNDQSNVPMAYKTKLLNPLKIGDKEILLEDGSNLNLPYKELNYLIPGKIFVNNEIIAFYDYEKLSDNSIKLKKIKRGFQGSYLNNLIDTNMDIYTYNENMDKIIKNSIKSISYQVKNSENQFIINGEIGENDIEVLRKPIIKLLTDINFDSKSFKISSNSIELPTENKKGYLYINDDKIMFSRIEKNDDETFSIYDFNIDKEYKSSESYILSKKYIEVKQDEYEIKSEEYFEEKYNDDNQKQEYTKLKHYIEFVVPPLNNEIITINNRN